MAITGNILANGGVTVAPPPPPPPPPATVNVGAVLTGVVNAPPPPAPPPAPIASIPPGSFSEGAGIPAGSLGTAADIAFVAAHPDLSAPDLSFAPPQPLSAAQALQLANAPPAPQVIVNVADELAALVAGTGETDFAALTSPGSLEFEAAVEAATGLDLSWLPLWEFDDPFSLRFLEANNPVLRGGDWVAALVDGCALYRLEAEAVAADAMGEGLGGGIGDGGLAYGPFQDHLTEYRGRPFYGRGKDNDVVNAWAWTRNGLEYSLRMMVIAKPSAAHLTGKAAVAAIVKGYERPADIPGQTALRQGYYAQLRSAGNQWVAVIAAKALGPTKGGKQLIGKTSFPAPAPSGSPKPTKAWAGLTHFLARDLPKGGADAGAAGVRARGAVRSAVWTSHTG